MATAAIRDTRAHISLLPEPLAAHIHDKSISSVRAVPPPSLEKIISLPSGRNAGRFARRRRFPAEENAVLR